MAKPSLLYISPVLPAESGGGTPMRAEIMLEALAERNRVYLLVVPSDLKARLEDVSPELSRWCVDIAVLAAAGDVGPPFLEPGSVPPRRGLSEPREFGIQNLRRRLTPLGGLADITRVFPRVAFDVIHVFRLYMAPFADPYLHAVPGERPYCVLDLDDVEPDLRRQVADLCEAQGDVGQASALRSEASCYHWLENEYLPRFDRLVVCCERDRQAILHRARHKDVLEVPNAVRLPKTPGPEPAGSPFTLLFVGTMNYYPNEDALRFFCTEVLPRIRAGASGPFRVLVVGGPVTPGVSVLSANPEVVLTGKVDEVAPYYGQTHIVIAPLRVSGGTSIKILEAFSYRRPVVSTRMAAGGYEVSHGREILLAESAPQFAEHCLSLMAEPDKGRQMADRAFEWVRKRHSPEAVKARLRGNLPRTVRRDSSQAIP